MSNTPPETLIIGMVDGQWPVQAFAVDAHALAWVSEGTNQPGNRRRLWLATLTDITELTVVPPVPAQLVAVDPDKRAELEILQAANPPLGVPIDPAKIAELAAEHRQATS